MPVRMNRGAADHGGESGSISARDVDGRVSASGWHAAAYEQALESARWPTKGFQYPECRHGQASVFEREGQQYWQCTRCHYQTRVIAGTIFEPTKLPLTSWFLLTQSKTNMAALKLKRHLGVSYPTAWKIKHELMQVMADRDKGLVLKGRIEIDDAYLGGEHPGTPGRGSENKVPFVAAVQPTADGKPQKVCFKAMRFTKEGFRTGPIGPSTPAQSRYNPQVG